MSRRMPELYAQAFDLVARTSTNAPEAISSALEDWVRPRWPKGVDWFQLDEPRALRGPDGSIYRWEPYADGTRRLLEFTWRHPHVEAPAIHWSTRVSFAVLPHRTYISIRVANTGPSIGQPGALTTTRPRLLLHLADHFAMKWKGTSFCAEPIRLGENDFRSFVRYELFDPQRQYPIALLSPDASGNYVISPQSLGREFIGIAKTYYAVSPESTYTLTSELGTKELSCFHGAARVYMPGLTKQTDPGRHPLLLPRRLSLSTERLRLARALTWSTVRSFEEEHFLGELRDERAVVLEEKRARLVGQLDKTRKAASDGEDFRQLAELYASQNEQLHAQLDQFREDLAEAATRLAEANHKIDALRYQLGQRLDAAEVGMAEPFMFPPANVGDAVEQAQATLADELLILPSAFESAEQSPFERPDEVATVLRKVAEVAVRARNGPLGKPLKDVFSDLGIDYRGGISRTTSKKLRQQYVFADGERTFVCEEHICLGGGTYDPAQCLRIYLNTKDRPDGRFVIGHVGRHMDVTSTT